MPEKEEQLQKIGYYIEKKLDNGFGFAIIKLINSTAFRVVRP